MDSEKCEELALLLPPDCGELVRDTGLKENEGFGGVLMLLCVFNVLLILEAIEVMVMTLLSKLGKLNGLDDIDVRFGAAVVLAVDKLLDDDANILYCEVAVDSFGMNGSCCSVF